MAAGDEPTDNGTDGAEVAPSAAQFPGDQDRRHTASHSAASPRLLRAEHPIARLAKLLEVAVPVHDFNPPVREEHRPRPRSTTALTRKHQIAGKLRPLDIAPWVNERPFIRPKITVAD